MTTTTAIFKVLGNDFRLQIVRILVKGEKNVSAINKTVKVSQPALSQHLQKLRRAGIVKSRRDERNIFYSIKDFRVVELIKILEG